MKGLEYIRLLGGTSETIKFTRDMKDFLDLKDKRISEVWAQQNNMYELRNINSNRKRLLIVTCA